MSLKTLERAVHRLEKSLPPLPNELFPFIDHLISQHPTLSRKHPTPPFSTALHTLQTTPTNCYDLSPDQAAIAERHHPWWPPPPYCGRTPDRIHQGHIDLFNDLLYHNDWTPIRNALDARWPRLRWALASQDPLYQAQGYHDALDLLARIVWQKSTDPFTYHLTQPTSEQEHAIYHQYRALPSRQRRQYRQEALKDAAFYCDPSPDLLQIFQELSEFNVAIP